VITVEMRARVTYFRSAGITHHGAHFVLV